MSCGWENTDLHGRKPTDLVRLIQDKGGRVRTVFLCSCVRACVRACVLLCMWKLGSSERDGRRLFKVGLATSTCTQVCARVFMKTLALKCVCKRVCVRVCVERERAHVTPDIVSRSLSTVLIFTSTHKLPVATAHMRVRPSVPVSHPCTSAGFGCFFFFFSPSSAR